MQIPAPDGVLLLCQLLFTSFPLNCGIYSLNFFFFFFCLNFQAEKSNKRHRPIGIGVQVKTVF